MGNKKPPAVERQRGAHFRLFADESDLCELNSSDETGREEQRLRWGAWTPGIVPERFLREQDRVVYGNSNSPPEVGYSGPRIEPKQPFFSRSTIHVAIFNSVRNYLIQCISCDID